MIHVGLRPKDIQMLHLENAQRQLFLDDLDIAEKQGLRRSMHNPDKKGAVIRPDLVKGGAPQIRTGPAWDPEAGLYKLWTLTATDTNMSVAGYYESRDGVHWAVPNLGQVESKGSYDNNFVAYKVNDTITLGPNSVVYDGTDPDASRRYKALSYART